MLREDWKEEGTQTFSKKVIIHLIGNIRFENKYGLG